MSRSKVRICALFNEFSAFVENNHKVGLGQPVHYILSVVSSATRIMKLTCVSSQNNGGSVLSKKTILSKDLSKDDLFGNLIKTTENIVKNGNRLSRVHRTGNGDPLLLASTQLDTLLADLSEISFGKSPQVDGQIASADDCVKPGAVISLGLCNDVGADSGVHNPGSLVAKGHF
ncbi:hypothetical protein HG531_006332 [Fusarium graminearum]|nr:hypothetical protein HG531_006332 [Fusarium graminearum]